MTVAQFKALSIGEQVFSPIAPSTPLVVHDGYYRKLDGRFVFFVAFDEGGRATVSQDETLVAGLQTKPSSIGGNMLTFQKCLIVWSVACSIALTIWLIS